MNKFYFLFYNLYADSLNLLPYEMSKLRLLHNITPLHFAPPPSWPHTFWQLYYDSYMLGPTIFKFCLVDIIKSFMLGLQLDLKPSKSKKSIYSIMII